MGYHIRRNRRNLILSSTGWKCYYCGCDLSKIKPERMKGRVVTQVWIDHAIPVSRGGGHGNDNLRPCCKACNIDKSDDTEQEYMAKLADGKLVATK